MSGLDGAFLHIETPETPMHVGALYLLAKPQDMEGSYFEEVKRLLMPRLSMSPFFRARLVPMPLNLTNPVWEENKLPNPEYHLRQVLLPHPGSMQQLQDKVAELHAELLDRNQPLWELTVIDGLADGNVAIYMKVHHAALDGASGVALVNVLFDMSATPRPIPDDWRERASRGQPSTFMQRLGVAVRQTGEQYSKLVRGIPDLVDVVTNLIKPAEAGARPAGKQKQNFALGPKTPLNVPITSERGFAAVSLPLAGIKRIAASHGVKLNDVVLGICSGAMRAYLKQHHQLPRKALIATIPVSLREAGDISTTTQATLTLVNLATNIADPLRRLQAISGAATAAKTLTNNAKAIMPTDFPSLGIPWLLGGLASLYGASKISSVVPPIANLLISNVAGPRQPLYVAGAQILSYWPLSIVEHGLGLNVTVMSYCDSLDIGLTVARNAVPDVHLLAQMVKQAYEELERLPSPEPLATEAAAPVAKPARPRRKVATAAAGDATVKPKPRTRKKPESN